MLSSRMLACVLSAGLLATGLVSAQNYPSKPVRIITSPVGSGNNLVARLLAQGLSGPLGQQVIVDNRAGGFTPGEAAAKSPPDGYAVFVGGSTFMIGPLLQKAPYDALRDFAPISLISKEPSVLIVHPSLPVKSVKELIALAKARPGELNYGSPGVGHLTPNLLRALAGINIVEIPYKGAGPLITALLGGELQLAFVTASVAQEQAKAGRVRALAVTSVAPSPLVPGLPTVAATVPGFEDVGATMFLAPAGTPATIISRLNQETVRYLNMPDTKAKLFDMGTDAIGSSPEQLAAYMKTEVENKTKVIRAAGIRAE